MAEFHNADWWNAELKRMLEEQRPEDLYLDYKDKASLLPNRRSGGGVDKQKRAEDISKDVSSFLNSDGGVLVYGVPETTDPNMTGGAPIPGGPDVGFQRGEIDKETVENLITSNIQPRPGPDLFRVSEVPYDGRVVFVVEVAVGIGDVWQGRDKRYYKRFNYKAEPMEHYEINLARNRNVGPDLKLVVGLNDRWETTYSGLDIGSLVAPIYMGIQNTSNSVEESALIELFWFPKDQEPSSPFGLKGNRQVRWYDKEWRQEGKTLVANSQLSWNPWNPELGGTYEPIYKTTEPFLVAKFDFGLGRNGLVVDEATNGPYPHRNKLFGRCFWRIQAPNMMPKHGEIQIQNRYPFNTDVLHIDELGTSFEIT